MSGRIEDSDRAGQLEERSVVAITRAVIGRVCSVPIIVLICLLWSFMPARGQTGPTPTPLPTSSVSAEPVMVDGTRDAAATRITADQLMLLESGMFAMLGEVAQETTSPLPGQSPAPTPYYNGRGSDGKFHLVFPSVDFNCIIGTHRPPPRSLQYYRDCFGTYLAAAADSGKAGPEMKAAYETAPDKQEFARTLGRALQLSNDAATKKSDDEVSAVKAIAIGTKRNDVYAILRARNIVVSNGLYNPGTPFGKDGLEGCSYGETEHDAEYPTFNEPLPVYRCLKFPHPRPSTAPTSPSASADLYFGFDLACGYSKRITLNFDDLDRLASIDLSITQQLCV